MIQIDSKKHAEMLQVALEILQGQEILIKDRRSLKINLKEHLELERESIYKGNELLDYKWLTEREGLRLLIKNWRDDELKHHKFLKGLSEKSYIPISSDDFVAVLREEEYLEKRYLLLKRLHLEKD
ncbi:MAG: Rubrerythrin protein [Thermoproteota archaeon]|nr:Rubrerythrin protein [Thermoproteota archaeon]